MLKIRLQRVGRKHDPSFRIVLTDRRNATKSGKFLEVLGSYNARFGDPVIKSDRVKYWIGVGAEPSNTVHNLLISEKIIEGKKINVLPKKSPIIKEKTEEEKKEDDKGDTVVEAVSEDKSEEKKEEATLPEVAPTKEEIKDEVAEKKEEQSEEKTAETKEEKKEETPEEKSKEDSKGEKTE